MNFWNRFAKYQGNTALYAELILRSYTKSALKFESFYHKFYDITELSF